jgi:DNA-binding CsgD family transcriptional regulator
MCLSQKRLNIAWYFAIVSFTWFAYLLIAIYQKRLHVTSYFLEIATLVVVSVGQLLVVRLFQKKGSPESWPSDFKFSSRETEVADLIITGFTNAQIANELCISVSTVKSHVRNVKRKANVHSRWELIRYVGPSAKQFSLKDES